MSDSYFAYARNKAGYIGSQIAKKAEKVIARSGALRSVYRGVASSAAKGQLGNISKAGILRLAGRVAGASTAETASAVLGPEALALTVGGEALYKGGKFLYNKISGNQNSKPPNNSTKSITSGPQAEMMHSKRPRSNSTYEAARQMLSFKSSIPRSMVAGKPLNQPIEEFKEYTNIIGKTTLTPGSLNMFNVLALPRDTSDSGRLGNECDIRRITLRMNVYTTPNATVTTYDEPYRAMLIWDNNPNGSLPPASSIFQTGSGANAWTAAATFQNLDNTSRFKILKTFEGFQGLVMGSSGGTKYGMSTVDWHECTLSYKVGELRQKYDGTAGGTIANVISGALYLVSYIGTGTALGTVGLEPTIRIRFQG